MQFGHLSGQDHATAVLRRAVASGHVPHAYLFEGPDGVGKRAAAYGLALALTCAVEPGLGCGTCESCRRIDAGLHPDVPVFAAETNQIVIEQAQAIGAHAIDARRAAIAAALADGSVARALRAAGAEDDAIWDSVSSLREAAAGGSGRGGPDVARIFDAAAAVAGDKEIKQALPPIL